MQLLTVGNNARATPKSPAPPSLRRKQLAIEQLHRPVHKRARPGTQIAVWRVHHVDRKRRCDPVRQQTDQRAAGQMRRRLESHQNADSQAGQGRGSIGVGVVDRDPVLAMHRDQFSVAFEADRRQAPGPRKKEIDHVLLAALEFPGMAGQAVALQVVRRGDGDELQMADAPGNQRLVAELAGANHAVHVVADQVYGPVTDPHIQLDVGKAIEEIAQRGNDQEAGHQRTDVHPQATVRLRLRVAHAGFEFVQIRQQTHDVVVVSRTVRGHRHPARRALEQLYPQARFQVLTLGNELLIESAHTIARPALARSRTLHSFGQPVGRLTIEKEIGGDLLTGLPLLVGSLVIAWLIWGPLRRLPLRELAAAESARLARDQYQRALLDNFPFMVWLKDTESRFLAVNARFAETFGRATTESLLGQTDLDIAPPELAEAYRADDRAVLRAVDRVVVHGRTGPARRLLADHMGVVPVTVAQAQQSDAFGRESDDKARPLNIEIRSSLDFSRATATGTSGGSIAIDPNSGARTVSGEIVDLGGSPFAGSAMITGEPGRDYSSFTPPTFPATFSCSKANEVLSR